MTTSNEENNRAATAATGVELLENLLTLLGDGTAPFGPKAECNFSEAQKSEEDADKDMCVLECDYGP